MRRSSSGVVQQMAEQLLEAVTKGDKVSEELIETAENIIQTHQLYVQLLYVGMVVERISALQHYFKALDVVLEDVDTEDLAEADAGTKLRAVSSFNQSIKNNIEVVNTMMASREAVNMLLTQMRDAFADDHRIAVDNPEASQDIVGKLEAMAPDKRQEILGGIVTMLRGAMTPDEESEDE